MLKDPVTRWVKLERADEQAVAKLAEARGVSFAEIVRRAVRTYLTRQKRR